MKKVALTAMAVLLAVSVVYAAPKKKVETTQPVVSAQELVIKKKAELSGTEWNVQMKPMGTKGKAETDVIIFAEDKVLSKNLEKLGFVATNFSVRLEEDGTVIWETMQVSEKEGTVFWRGDIGPDGIMRGVLSKRDKKNNAADFNFVSVPK